MQPARIEPSGRHRHSPTEESPVPNKESRYGDATRALAPENLLRPLRAAVGGFQRLADLEISGRTMMTFMRGHMAEARQFQEPYEYFSSFYNRMGREFLQFDDYDFVVHHCVRSQFWHIKEELDLLQGSALGRALRDIGAPLPELTAPTTPGRRPPGRSRVVRRSVSRARGRCGARTPRCAQRGDALGRLRYEKRRAARPHLASVPHLVRRNVGAPNHRLLGHIA